MKTRIIIFTAAALVLSACAKDSIDDWVPGPSDSLQDMQDGQRELVVTVKQDATGTVFFQKGNTGRLFPKDGYEFHGECRALGSFYIYPVEEPGYGRICDVEWLEEIDRGHVVTAPGPASVDGLDVDLQSNITAIEDGYLTVDYYTWWADPAGHHDLTLVYIGNNEFNLVHNANGDAHDVYAEGLVYFDINGFFPDTGGETIPVTVNWLTTKDVLTSAKFGFISRK
ncbi:MAG: hypothetical protein J5695_05645 [Bacteroidales bacterium]|nr:hypothetical protein [Bacteroidales bacterium]